MLQVYRVQMKLMFQGAAASARSEQTVNTSAISDRLILDMKNRSSRCSLIEPVLRKSNWFVPITPPDIVAKRREWRWQQFTSQLVPECSTLLKTPGK